MVAEKTEKKELKGIGGWLLLPTIGLFFAAIIYVAGVFIAAMSLIFTEVTADSLVYLFGSLALLLLVIYCLILEFKKNNNFPKWYIIVIWAGVLFAILLSIMDGDFSDVSSSFLGAAVWTAYMIKSVRVKNTFVKK